MADKYEEQLEDKIDELEKRVEKLTEALKEPFCGTCGRVLETTNPLQEELDELRRQNAALKHDKAHWHQHERVQSGDLTAAYKRASEAEEAADELRRQNALYVAMAKEIREVLSDL